MQAKKRFMKTGKIATLIDLSTGYTRKLLTELKKEGKIALYKRKYWGIDN